MLITKTEYFIGHVSMGSYLMGNSILNFILEQNGIVYLICED